MATSSRSRGDQARQKGRRLNLKVLMSAYGQLEQYTKKRVLRKGYGTRRVGARLNRYPASNPDPVKNPKVLPSETSIFETL